MADYWKSQPRKFCTFCECWFGDNRASIDFHERGKRHQENVKKKINQVRDKASSDAKEDEKLEASLKAMEKAALASLKNDVASDPTMASQYGIQDEMADKIVALTQAKQAHERAEQEARKALEVASRQLMEKKKNAVWMEAKSAEGYSYYYNKENKETTWTKPDLFLTLDEQNSIDEERRAKKAKKEEKKSKEAGSGRISDHQRATRAFRSRAEAASVWQLGSSGRRNITTGASGPTCWRRSVCLGRRGGSR